MAGNLDFKTTLFFLVMMTMMSFMVVAQLEPKVVQAESKPRIVTIRQDGTGDFKTIMDAVNTVPEGNTQRTILRIAPGIYKEKVFVNRSKPFVTLYGDDPRSNPVISYGATAAQVGTWDSATVAVESDYFMAANIIFENSSPMPDPGAEGGQAVAMRISGDKAAFYNCRFLGYQDTLLDDVGMHYFQDCFIQGMVDFIFGKGRSMYMKCEIHSVAKGITAITAQGRAGIEDNGFVFINCMISGIGNAYLGRAWKDSSRVIMAYTHMSELVNEKGWNNFDHPEYNDKLFYAEYKCTGPGAVTSKRVPYSKLLNDEEVKPFLSKTFINADIWLLPAPKF